MDDIRLVFTVDHVDWHIVAEVYRRAPLGNHEPEKLQRAFQQSDVCCFAYRGTDLIGAGRAISDGEFFATICDLVVLPEYQRQGVGKTIMKGMIEKLAVPKVILACVLGQEGFYRKLGFLRHKSVMALYPNVAWFKENGYLE